MNICRLVLTIFLFSCSSMHTNSKLASMWKNNLNKQDVIKIYGLKFDQIAGGISYSRPQSAFPHFVFFFDKDDKITDQFSLINDSELKKLKGELPCKWIENEQVIATAHAIHHAPQGECQKYNVGYKLKIDSGLYEVRWRNKL